ncbi:bifunctional 4-hydroxy-2-oxoglutarate aldolase/2-dehydro-3-deoxy-phosphogluconate aldolase [Spirochaeta cellobiosiphila]|uniref:bifunctional 4-hydroxy-2-oxoglutarate aldolase/2-dehydro-3-deoxy-phosphogluconate aldolase n=1 Tax=Spirochaeta cellobiosiphila TaxID=504483 RepID=UPI0003FF3DBF|nr:bifunctional 4-hydroxy-2-oxoglutarate aldolase/2-dehydro-3-deoxy-phosphogluconate aldolase [Spirochaeta cellobiosiphila]
MSNFHEKTEAVVEALGKVKVVPVLAIEKVEDGIKMCQILDECGLKAAEITFRTKAAEGIIKEAAKQFPELVLGAGTVLNVEDLHKAFDAGAQFAVAPGFNPVVVEEAVKNAYPFFPGFCTPSELEQIMQFGIRMVKFFPAEAAGGVKMISNVTAPYKHLGVKVMPTGGVKPENFGDYLSLPQVVCSGGTWVGKADDINSGSWDKIRSIVKDAVLLASKN